MNADSYAAFLAGKAPRPQSVGIEPGPLPAHLFDFQAACVDFALRQGRAALFLSTGLGKTLCQLEFARQAAAASNDHALILTPLAVARQFEAEAHRFGYDARVIREQAEARPGINICNYDRLDRLDPSAFGAVCLDEAGILKSFTGATSRALRQAFADTRFKLVATATPAPNDHMELGQQAEFLGVMASNEMLARWFVSDQTQMGRYRLKRHGEHAFWDWMASWARMAEGPEDLGFDGSRFVLPELHITKHKTVGQSRPATWNSTLFMPDVSAVNMHKVKRETAGVRAEAAAALVAAEPSRPWLVWCDNNDEADALTSAIGPDAIEVRGSMSAEQKENALAEWMSGERRVLVSKASIFGMGMNLQRCARVIFVGRSFSYEAWFQAVRRCWRFGQTEDVHVHLLVAEGEDQIGRVIDRKAADHAVMKRAMAAAMQRDRAQAAEVKVAYDPHFVLQLPEWVRAS